MFFLEGMKSSVFEDQHLILSMLMFSWDLDVLQWQLIISSLEIQKQMFEETLQIGNLFEVPSLSMSTQKYIPLLLVRDLIDGISTHQRQVRLYSPVTFKDERYSGLDPGSDELFLVC